jgi:alkylation response protein AidB-like acyl-CoA dehydrogenase
MDFAYSEDEIAVRDLAHRIMSDNTSHERLRELDLAKTWFDMSLWRLLSEAGLTALSLPEAIGGGGLGFIETCLVLEEVGRAVAPVPMLPTAVLGGAPIAQFGSDEQQAHWLQPVALRNGVLTAALEEVGGVDPTRPKLRATRDGAHWRLDGEKTCVPAAHLAHGIVVPARTGDEKYGLFVVEPDAAGVSLATQFTTNHEPHAHLTLDAAVVPAIGVLGNPLRGRHMVEWLLTHARVALCAVQLGVAQEALRRTAAYTSERKQFGRQIGSFQAVAMRAADAFIDIECMRATLTLAAWRLSQGLPAEAETSAAKWWACRGGQRVVHTAQHLHAGVGSDSDYPIHRFYLWSKQLELSLGGASQQLEILGDLVMRDAPGSEPPDREAG